MMKILSRAFDGPYSEMVADLEKGDMPGSAKKVCVFIFHKYSMAKVALLVLAAKWQSCQEEHSNINASE